MTRISFLALLLTACPAEPDDSGKPDGTDTADTAADTDSGDTAADTDSGDSGADTGDGDTGDDDSGESGDSDSGPADSGADDSGPADSGADDSGPADSGPADSGDGDSDDSGSTGACDVRDLVPSAEIRGAAGTAGTSFATTDNLSMVAILSNPCTSDITFDTPDTCLFTGASVTASSGMGTGVGVACGGAVTSWTIAAGASKEEAYSWGRLSADTYQLDVTFNIRGVSATERFEVL